LPPRASNNSASVGVVPSQTLNVPFVPAFGAICSVTDTIAVAVAQLAVPRIVYVYVKPELDQVPPLSGLPPNATNNSASVGVVPSQIVKVPFIPAFGEVCSVIVIVAVASSVQGVVAFTV